MHLNSRESPYCGLYNPTRSASPPSFHFSGLFFFSSHQFPQTPWSTHWSLKTPGKFPLGSFVFAFASLKNILLDICMAQPHPISLPCLPTYICAHISASLPVTMDMLFLLISQIPISNGSYTFLLTQGQLSSNCPFILNYQFFLFLLSHSKQHINMPFIISSLNIHIFFFTSPNKLHLFVPFQSCLYLLL